MGSGTTVHRISSLVRSTSVRSGMSPFLRRYFTMRYASATTTATVNTTLNQ